MASGWDTEDPVKLAEFLERRANDFEEKAYKRHVGGGDWRPVLREMASILKRASRVMAAIVGDNHSLRQQRNTWQAERNTLIQGHWKEKRELLEKLETLKRDNATMWTELLRYRNQASIEPDAQGRRFYGDE